MALVCVCNPECAEQAAAAGAMGELAAAMRAAETSNAHMAAADAAAAIVGESEYLASRGNECVLSGGVVF